MRFSHLTRPFFTHRGLREGGSLPYKYISHRGLQLSKDTHTKSQRITPLAGFIGILALVHPPV